MHKLISHGILLFLRKERHLNNDYTTYKLKIERWFQAMLKGTVTKLSNWGNSKGVRIPSNIVKDLKLINNQKMDIYAENGTIVIRPITERPKSLADLFKGYRGGKVQGHEMKWGHPKGHEYPW